MTTLLPRRRWLRARGLLFAVLGTLVWGASGARELNAQEPTAEATLSGRIEDQDGQPVPNWPIALHRLDRDGSGEELATAVTDSAGVFEFTAEFSEQGLYFVATRFDNTIYVGAPFQAPGPPEGDYVVLVGDPSTGLPLGGPLPEAATVPGGPPTGLPFAGIGLAAFALVSFLTLSWRNGPRGRWQAVAVQLAELDEAYAAQGDTVPAHERELYEQRRKELWNRLLRRTGAR